MSYDDYYGPPKNGYPNLEHAVDNRKPSAKHNRNVDGSSDSHKQSQNEYKCEEDVMEIANAGNQKTIVSCGDETSNKRKTMYGNDVPTMSLTQTSKTSPTKGADLQFSIPVSSLQQLGNFGELSFTVSSNRNHSSRPSNRCNNSSYNRFEGESIYSHTRSKNESQWTESRGDLNDKEWKKKKFKMNRQLKRQKKKQLELAEERGKVKNSSNTKDALVKDKENVCSEKAVPPVLQVPVNNGRKKINLLPVSNDNSNTTSIGEEETESNVITYGTLHSVAEVNHVDLVDDSSVTVETASNVITQGTNKSVGQVNHVDEFADFEDDGENEEINDRNTNKSNDPDSSYSSSPRSAQNDRGIILNTHTLDNYVRNEHINFSSSSSFNVVQNDGPYMQL